MNSLEQKQAAKAFVERWKAAEGNEQSESNKYWIELFGEVLGVANPTYVLDFERKVKGRRIDVFHEDVGVLIENKSRGIDLDAPEVRGKDSKGNPRMETPYEQAKWYADNITPRSVTPRWIVTCNFDEIRIYDLDEDYPEKTFETITLDELPEQVHRLSFMVRKENSRAEREKELSVAAGTVVGKLYDALAAGYQNIEEDETEQQSLNILITRIVFLLYAEDADLLHEKDAFYKYLKGYQAAHMNQALKILFEVLKTPEGERDPYMDAEALKFPYINGGLFERDIAIPPFNEDTRFTLLQEASAEFDWRNISPTIFGAVFESTLNPETRRAGGMHYTSVENIHKVTGPLFYDELKDELTTIEGINKVAERNFKLNAFLDKIASIKVLDPACGSGNFLTETYLSFRKLENRVLENLYGSEQARLIEMQPIKVKVDQFYGIEINDFAVEVAKTALWIAELQMIEQTREIMGQWIDPLPLKNNDNIHCGNALRMDWNDVISACECDYVIGNPPFYGYTFQTEEQKIDVGNVFEGTGVSKKVDYVSCWYEKALEYCRTRDLPALTRCSFVSTNSICQGEQVPDLWKHFVAEGMTIDFAWQTFVWDSEATDQAHVHVVIIGFHIGDKSDKCVLFKNDLTAVSAESINPYLVDAPVVLIESRSKPISDVPPINKGSQPTDGGNLIIASQEELDLITKNEPVLSPYIKRFVGSEEFINDKWRWCFWLVDAPLQLIESSPELRKRLDAVREMRAASTKAQTRAAAANPAVFTEIRQPKSDYILVPRVSSERRRYVPIGFLAPDDIASDSAQVIPNASLYHFGILTSQFHNAWMRTVAGRLEMRYRYSNKIVYNNYVWPNPTDAQKQHIEWCAQQVLDARDRYPDKSLADLYDPDKMPSDLKQAHQDLDNAVEVAYGVNFGGDEEKIVAHLFKLYAEATKGEK